MTDNVLNKIINKKEQRLNELKKTVSIEFIKEKIDQNKNYIDFKKKIENNILKKKYHLLLKLKKQALLLV